jgi:hypothetical protein
MEGTNPPRAESPPASSLTWFLAFAVVLLLTAGHGWLTLARFGTEQPWEPLTSDAPLLAGRHPLHLYHGYLGARGLLEHGCTCCFDPAFQAGYPKTPVFDGGSRPAELFLTLGGGAYHPAAYKIGLFACCCLVPLFIACAAVGAGLGPGATVFATLGGVLAWWGEPCQALLEAGDLSFLLALLAVLVTVGLLLRIHVLPTVKTWIGLALASAIGWYADPLLYPLLLGPLVLVYALSVGTRHGMVWHLAVSGAALLGIAVNAFWLADWVEYWWLRSPLLPGERFLAHRTFHTFWTTDFWGEPLDRTLAVFLFSSALVGLVMLNQNRQRPAARLLGLGTVGLLALALVGIGWEPLGRYGAARCLTPALWFAALPAAFAWGRGFGLLASWWRSQRVSAAVSTLLLGAAIGVAGFWIVNDPSLFQLPPVWPIGFDTEQQQTVDLLKSNTGPEARILWENSPHEASLWSALLPLQTGRAYLGGLMPGAVIDYAYPELSAGKLDGRPLAEWTDGELDELAHRYNIGWVACASAEAAERFRRWSGVEAAKTEALPGLSGGRLFALKRPASFVLKGQARWLQADSQYITLADVVPEDGVVVLSLHYQTGLRVLPDLVQLERDPGPSDPVAFLRLRMPGPMTRLVLSWEKP